MRFLLASLLIFVPSVVLAANTDFFGQIVPKCTEGGDGLCQACNLVQLAQNMLRFMVSLGVMAAAVMFAYAGFLYVTAASNQQNLESAKKVFVNTFLGLIFIIGAFLIVDLVLHVLTGDSFKVLTRIQCVQRVQTGPLSIAYNPVGDAVVEGTGAPVAPTATVASTGGYCSGAQWNVYEQYVQSAVDSYAPELQNITASDIGDFCPNYASLDSSGKKAVAARLVSSMARYESNCNPNNAYPESGFSNPDSVTGLPVVSEGLLQLSYQDENTYKNSAPPGVCDFTYAQGDIRDPKKNLTCGVFILNQQLKNHGSIAYGQSYWSILRSGQYSKLAEVRAAVRAVPGCI